MLLIIHFTQGHAHNPHAPNVTQTCYGQSQKVSVFMVDNNYHKCQLLAFLATILKPLLQYVSRIF